MKKIGFFLLILAIFSVVLVGCGKKEQTQEKTGTTREANRRPDFGQPERQSDIGGLVKSITGNEITILKFERPQSPEGNEDDSEERPANFNPSAAFGGGGGHPGGGMMRSRSMDENSRTEMLERMKEMSSGEEKVIIPVGIQMLKTEMNEGDDVPTSVEATLTDIKTDKMVRIWLDENVSDRKIASFVLISN